MAKKIRKSSLLSKKVKNTQDQHINFINLPNNSERNIRRRRRDSLPKRFSINSLDEKPIDMNLLSETIKKNEGESSSNFTEYFFNLLRKEPFPDSLLDTTQTERRSKMKSTTSSRSDYFLNIFKYEKDSITKKIDEIVIEEINNRLSKILELVFKDNQPKKKPINKTEKELNFKELECLVRKDVHFHEEENDSYSSSSSICCSHSCCCDSQSSDKRGYRTKTFREYFLECLEEYRRDYSKSFFFDMEKDINSKLDLINSKLVWLREYLVSKDKGENNNKQFDQKFSLFSNKSNLFNVIDEKPNQNGKNGIRLSTLSDTQLEEIKTFFHQEFAGKSKKLSSDIWSNLSSSKFGTESGNLKLSTELNSKHQRTRENSLKNSDEFIQKAHITKSNRWVRESSSSINIKGRSSRKNDGNRRKGAPSISIQTNYGFKKAPVQARKLEKLYHVSSATIYTFLILDYPLQEDSSYEALDNDQTGVEIFSPLFSSKKSSQGVSSSSLSSIGVDNEYEQVTLSKQSEKLFSSQSNLIGSLMSNKHLTNELNKHEILNLIKKKKTKSEELQKSVIKGLLGKQKKENYASEQKEKITAKINDICNTNQGTIQVKFNKVNLTPREEISSDESARKIITLHSLSSSCDFNKISDYVSE